MLRFLFSLRVGIAESQHHPKLPHVCSPTGTSIWSHRAASCSDCTSSVEHITATQCALKHFVELQDTESLLSLHVNISINSLQIHSHLCSHQSDITVKKATVLSPDNRRLVAEGPEASPTLHSGLHL